MIKLIVDHCFKHHLFKPGDRLLLACSGGADSISMVHAFLQIAPRYDLKLFVAHAEHGIRGQSSLDDASFVENFCQKHGITFFSEHLNVPKRAREKKIGLEDAARQLRYDFLYRTAARLKADAICLAHHRGDQAETVLMHLIRGSGLDGLGGILPKNGLLIRPLLSLTREQIETYCHENGLLFCHDATNDDTAYTRNKIRHMLLPLLKDYNPNIETALCHTADLISETANFMRDSATAFLCQHANQDEGCVKIPLLLFNGQHIALKRQILRSALKKSGLLLFDIGFGHIDSVIALANTCRTGTGLNLPHGITASISYNRLILARKQKSSLQNNAPIAISIPDLTSAISYGCKITASLCQERMADTRECCFFDYDKVGHSLFLRSRQNGDYFFPKGMDGKKKLKDFFIDKKIPRDRRKSWPLICNADGAIIWICGLQADRRFLPDGNTKTFLCLQAAFILNR